MTSAALTSAPGRSVTYAIGTWTPLLVRDPDDRGLEDVRVGVDHAFHFHGGDDLPARDDDVLQPEEIRRCQLRGAERCHARRPG